MKNFIEDFKAFAIKGNVVELAVAVVIGGAFGKIVSSLVTNIITPLIGVLMGGINFTGLEIHFKEAVISYGIFIQSIVDFLIVSSVIFIAIRIVGRFHEKEEEKNKEIPEEIALLREIRDSLKNKG